MDPPSRSNQINFCSTCLDTRTSILASYNESTNGGASTKEESLCSRRGHPLTLHPHHRYEPSECWSWPDGCNVHLSGAYKGPCWPWKDDDCNRVCIGENSDNFSGSCYSFQCWCYTKCDS
ncbi:hypothetical protein BS78_K261400 [Paspalum vaginatum]|uniref:Knottins-like domain-containing protein n=1 Tax=Paspalum vaginatum TaxID=158149 RepID=A0A9W7XD60_9POAL|nr:hypothetical protein BS78_K261400 [Paspalum vaginatum]